MVFGLNKDISSPEDVNQFVAQGFQKIYGDNLVSVVLYGSGASGEYIPGKSDLNYIVVLKNITAFELEKGRPFIKELNHRWIKIPMFFTENEVKTSTDTYPIDIIEIKENHKIIFGKDLFIDLTINNSNMRVQCEYELKGKIHEIRRMFLSLGFEQDVGGLILLSFNSILTMIRAALRLKKVQPPVKKDEAIIKANEHLSLDRDVFMEILRYKQKEIKLTKEESLFLFRKYLIEVEKLEKIVDGIERNS